MSVVEMKRRPPVEQDPQTEELRSFLHVVYRSLKMVCAYLEKRYGF